MRKLKPRDPLVQITANDAGVSVSVTIPSPLGPARRALLQRTFGALGYWLVTGNEVLRTTCTPDDLPVVLRVLKPLAGRPCKDAPTKLGTEGMRSKVYA